MVLYVDDICDIRYVIILCVYRYHKIRPVSLVIQWYLATVEGDMVDLSGTFPVAHFHSYRTVYSITKY